MFLSLLSGWLACAQVTAPAPPRVLVYTVSAGYEHEVVKRSLEGDLSLVERTLVDWGEKSGSFQAIVSRASESFTRENLSQFGAVLFYTTGELPLSVAQREALFAFVRRGGGFVGVHSATDTFYEVPEYAPMIGAVFDGHPWHERVSIIVEDRAHASTRHLGNEFEIVDEIYQFKAPYARQDVHVLLSLAPVVLDLEREAVHRSDRDFALAWTRPHGAGRVFYTALGHRPEVWREERFLAHLTGGIRWATRTEPRAPMPAFEEKRRKLALAGGGDPRAGFEIFKREGGPMCARCHVVNGLGTAVGPDLSAVARRLTQEELLDSILAPSTTIAHGYEAVTLELAAGTTMFGRIVSETAEALTWIDTNGVPHVTARREVKKRVASRVSVMPDGLTATLSDEEFLNLAAYVRTLKAPPPATPK